LGLQATIETNARTRRQNARPAGAAIVLFIVAITAIAAVFALNRASAIAQTSDSAQSFVEASALPHGNALLAGWNLPLDDYYVTDTVLYAVGERLFGPQPILLVVIPALTYALFAGTALVLCLSRAGPLTHNATACAAAAFMLVAPAPTGEWNPLVMSDMHFATVLAALISLGLISRVGSVGPRSTILVAAALAVTVAATVASDPFSLVFAFGPALVLLTADALLPPSAREDRFRLALTAAGTLAGLALPFLVGHAGGFTTENITVTSVVPLPRLGRNLIAVLANLLSLFGANPFRAGTSLWLVLLVLLRLGAFAIAVAAAATTARQLFRTHLPAFDRLLCAGILTDLLACALSTQFGKGVVGETAWLGGPPMRYGMPAALFAMILGARCLARWLSGLTELRPRILASSALACVFVLTLLLNDFTLTDARWEADNPALAAASWLERKGLTTGLGEYWSANLVTAMSGDAVEVASVVPRDGRIVPYVLSADRNWYATAPRFVIWHEPNKTNLSLREVRATYDVCRIVTVATYRIALVARSGSRTCPHHP